MDEEWRTVTDSEYHGRRQGDGRLLEFNDGAHRIAVWRKGFEVAVGIGKLVPREWLR